MKYPDLSIELEGEYQPQYSRMSELEYCFALLGWKKHFA